jgi:Uma2 family endonuclease
MLQEPKAHPAWVNVDYPGEADSSSFFITAEMFLRMDELEMFAGTRVELIRGEIFKMPQMGISHAQAINTLSRSFAKFADHAYVWNQCPLRLSSESVPMPDICLLKMPVDQYTSSLPTAASVLLVVEVSDTSLRYDRLAKLPLYAAAGIPEYWIVNLSENQLEVYRDPQDADYLTRTTLRPGTLAQALCLPEPVEW